MIATCKAEPIVAAQTGFRVKFALPAMHQHRVGDRGGMAARGAGAVGNAGGARATAGRRPATCPAPANHSPPLRLMLTRLRDYASKFIKIPPRYTITFYSSVPKVPVLETRKSNSKLELIDFNNQLHNALRNAPITMVMYQRTSSSSEHKLPLTLPVAMVD